MNPIERFTKEVESALMENGVYPQDERFAASLLASIQAATAKLLIETRFNSYWGDGSPTDMDKVIKQLDPAYDPVEEIARRDFPEAQELRGGRNE